MIVEEGFSIVLVRTLQRIDEDTGFREKEVGYLVRIYRMKGEGI